MHQYATLRHSGAESLYWRLRDRVPKNSASRQRYNGESRGSGIRGCRMHRVCLSPGPAARESSGPAARSRPAPSSSWESVRATAVRPSVGRHRRGTKTATTCPCRCKSRSQPKTRCTVLTAAHRKDRVSGQSRGSIFSRPRRDWRNLLNGSRPLFSDPFLGSLTRATGAKSGRMSCWHEAQVHLSRRYWWHVTGLTVQRYISVFRLQCLSNVHHTGCQLPYQAQRRARLCTLPS